MYYCDVFISCLDSHSDGTHSLQSIHCWTSDKMLHFSKSDEETMTNSSTSWMLWDAVTNDEVELNLSSSLCRSHRSFSEPLVFIYLSTSTSRFIKHAQGIDTCGLHPSNHVLFIFRAKKDLFNGKQVASACVRMCVCTRLWGVWFTCQNVPSGDFCSHLNWKAHWWRGGQK